MFSSNFFFELLMLYAVLDPIAAIPIFLSVTSGLSRKEKTIVAFLAVAISFSIFLFFIAIGHHLLNALHIPMASFQLAGSLILLLFGLQMVLGQIHATKDEERKDITLLQRASFPLAIPCIAGSGSIMTVMMLTDNLERSYKEQLQTIGVLSLCLFFLFIMFLMSGFIQRILGRGGIEIITRVFGLIITSIAVTNIITAIKISFNIST
jgi:multiple antibiotic resistance protein